MGPINHIFLNHLIQVNGKMHTWKITTNITYAKNPNWVNMNDWLLTPIFYSPGTLGTNETKFEIQFYTDVI